MYTVFGIEEVNYKSKKTGNQVTGKRYHCIYTNKSVEGNAVEVLFVSSACESPTVRIGDAVDVFYNRFGSVVGLKVVKMAPISSNK